MSLVSHVLLRCAVFFKLANHHFNLRLINEEYNEASTVLEGGMSFEDRKAQEIVDRSVTLLDGHYQVKLPFRQDPPPPTY